MDAVPTFQVPAELRRLLAPGGALYNSGGWLVGRCASGQVQVLGAIQVWYLDKDGECRLASDWASAPDAVGAFCSLYGDAASGASPWSLLPQLPAPGPRLRVEWRGDRVRCYRDNGDSAPVEWVAKPPAPFWYRAVASRAVGQAVPPVRWRGWLMVTGLAAGAVVVLMGVLALAVRPPGAARPPVRAEAPPAFADAAGPEPAASPDEGGTVPDAAPPAGPDGVDPDRTDTGPEDTGPEAAAAPDLVASPAGSSTGEDAAPGGPEGTPAAAEDATIDTGDAATDTGDATAADNGGAGTEAGGEAGTPAFAASKWPLLYMVESGDTLSGISRKVYGSEEYVHLIRTANQLEGDLIGEGQVLLMPAPPPEGPF